MRSIKKSARDFHYGFAIFSRPDEDTPLSIRDGYIHTYTGTFDFTVSYGKLNSKSFKFGQGEQEGFILSDPKTISNPASDVETSWGVYKVRAGELLFTL